MHQDKRKGGAEVNDNDIVLGFGQHGSELALNGLWGGIRFNLEEISGIKIKYM